MAEIKNLQRLIAKLDARVAKAIKDSEVSAVVGYTAGYAIYVHENMEIWPPGMRLAGQPRPRGRGYYWDPQGQAQPKFLEQPARELSANGTLRTIIVSLLRSGRTVAEALLAAAMMLQSESMRLVPVNTGNLRASAFTRLERG